MLLVVWRDEKIWAIGFGVRNACVQICVCHFISLVTLGKLVNIHKPQEGLVDSENLYKFVLNYHHLLFM